MILDNYVDLGLAGAHRDRVRAEKYPLTNIYSRISHMII